MSNSIPQSLIDAAKKNRLIPVIGAGISMSILDKCGQSVFPSWKKLLKLASIELEKEKQTKLSRAIEAVLDLGDYQSAANYAREGLSGGLWVKFFKKNFDIDKNVIDEESLALPREIWSISRKVITLNYDKVMTWSCPYQNLIEIDNTNKIELLEFTKESDQSPYIWHLHGRIGNLSEIIFTSESYGKLYGEHQTKYSAAISILKKNLIDNQLMFVGCSLDDAELLEKISEHYNLFDGNSGPHYALVNSSNIDNIQKKLDNTPIEVIPYDGHGKPLLELINSIRIQAYSNNNSNISDSTQISILPDIIPDKKIDIEYLNILKKQCSHHNNAEIERVAKKKYIKGLYVARDVESTLKTLLVSDEMLSNKLMEVIDFPYNITSKSKGFLEKNLKSLEGDNKYKLKHYEDQISISTKIDELLKCVLSNLEPGSGKNRPTFIEIGSLLKKLKLAPLNFVDETLLDKSISIVNTASKFITVVVDRAGGGKTNLLCHLAKVNNAIEPSVFLGGRVIIESKNSLLLALANSLGANLSDDPHDYIVKVDKILESSQCHTTIFIDGINENRDIGKLNVALEYLFSSLEATRFRFVLSCRDIYWTFFKSENWVKYCNVVEGNLYSFSRREQELALDAYLKYFKIEVNLGPLAYERCKHPLLLRFFCEAYSSDNNEKTNLGNVYDIRLKPLFDDYWKAKIGNNRSKPRVGNIESTIYKLIDYIIDTSQSSLTTNQIADVTGIVDLKTEQSTYLELLDEDIIIEENPTSSADVRKVVFVYEEFMEYAAARYLQDKHKHFTKKDVDDHFELMNNKMSEFVNILGIMEYLCAFYLEKNKLELAFHIVINMARTGGQWLPIITNIFSKYDSAPSMLVTISNDELNYIVDKLCPDDESVDLKGIDIVLNAIAQNNRSLMTEVGVLLIYSAILPNIFSLQDIAIQKLPKNMAIRYHTSSNSNAPRVGRLIKLVSKYLGGYDKYWQEWGSTRKYAGLNDRAELLKALTKLLIGAKRRNSILTLACNGLFDDDVLIRRASAFITRDLNTEYCKKVRESSRALESDIETIKLLGNRFL